MQTSASANPGKTLSSSGIPSPQSFVFKSSRYTIKDSEVQPGWVRQRPKLSDTLLRSHATGATNVVDSPNGFIPLPSAKALPQSLSKLPIFLQANGLPPIDSPPLSPSLSQSTIPPPLLPRITPQSTPALTSAPFSPSSPAPSALVTPPDSLSRCSTHSRNVHSLSLTEVFAELRTPPATASGGPVSKYGCGPRGSYFPLDTNVQAQSRKSPSLRESDKNASVKVIENAGAMLRTLEWQEAGEKLRGYQDELDIITDRLAALSLESAGFDTVFPSIESEQEQNVN